MVLHPARVTGKPWFDLIGPVRVQRSEVEVKPRAVPRAIRVQIVPNQVHLFVRECERHALHEDDQIVLGAPLAAVCEHLSSMHIQRSNPLLGPMAEYSNSLRRSRPGAGARPGCVRSMA